MARALRIHEDYAFYHVMLRGNNGQAIFFSDKDQFRMGLFIQEGVERFGHKIHAFCFMSNHIHLLVQVKEITISEIMKNLAARYTMYINRKYEKVGHLFQGRFKAILVDSNTYLNELMRYIHLNPVRANLVDLPEKYKWSSHRVYLMLQDCSWVTRKEVLGNFGATHEQAVKNLDAYVLQGIGVESEIDFKVGVSDGILGGQAFIERMLARQLAPRKKKINLGQLVLEICNHFSVTQLELKEKSRSRLQTHACGVIAYFVREAKELALEDLAKFLSRDASGLSKLANRIGKKCRESKAQSDEIEKLRELIFCTDVVMS
jgi:putative transposase